jgi:hypothetical protein
MKKLSTFNCILHTVYCLLLTVYCLLFTSCIDEFLTRQPKNLLSEESIWGNGGDRNAIMALLANYYDNIPFEPGSEVGYSLPKKWLDPVKIHDLRVYVAGTNLFSIDPHPYSDPETAGWYYPITKIWTVGVNLTF